MAIIEVKVPQLSESVSEATLLDWHKKEGEAVKRDENLIDIETDKVVLELPAPADGVLVKIVKKNRESVGSGDLIAQIDTEAKAGASAPSSSPEKKAELEKARPAAPAVMPAAQKIAAEKGIDTSAVQGTGRDGRVTKGDVLSQGDRKPAESATAPPSSPRSTT
jgi:2-oxoglutarate dehydrogenase E2 component (dihydrolipoamide succinyltransferase)